MALNQSSIVRVITPQNTTYFVGFNTVEQPTPPYSLTNVDLVKRDLLNTFATPLGSRFMLPNFGTNIYSYLFDPFDDITKQAIIEDAINVIQGEPRVQLVSIDAFQQGQTLTIAVILLFQPQALTESLYVTFSTQNQESI
jgi:phage baseplate assembly protein W